MSSNQDPNFGCNLTLGEVISPVEQLHWTKTLSREEDRELRKTQFLEALKSKDTETLERLVKEDPRFCKCESCGKYFLRPSKNADAHICPDCHCSVEDKLKEGDGDDKKYQCRWCGKYYSLSQYWCSRCYCSVDCREKFNKSELRNESVQRRETLLKNLKKGII